MPVRLCARGSALAALLLLLAPFAEAAGGDPYRAHVFSTLDRGAVAVGDVVELNVEVLAAPTTGEAAEALVAAFSRAAPGESAGVEFVRAWPASRRLREGVLELQRRYDFRVLESGEVAVPEVVLDVPHDADRTLRLATRPHALRGYAAWPGDAARSVFPIVAESRDGRRTVRRTGSAWLAAPDALVTAYHVVVGARRVRVRLPSGETVSLGRVWALDPERDVAVLHIAPRHTRGLAPLLVAAPDADASGEVAFTAGWPLLDRADDDGFGRRQLRTSAARFEGIGEGARALRVSGNAVRPGDSGGALLNAEGHVIGVVVSGRSTDGEADLLREDVCLATDPVPALRARAERPEKLASALRETAEADPAARAHLAATHLTAQSVPEHERSRQRETLLEAVRESPRDASLQFLAATVLEALGDDAEAARAYRGAHAEGYFPAAYALAHHHLEASPARAAALFEEVRQSAPYAHLGAMGHARALTLLGRWTEAEHALENVLDHDPRFAPALYLLGVVRLAQGREVEARALALRLEARPEWAASLRTLLRHDVLRPSRVEPLARAELGAVSDFRR